MSFLSALAPFAGPAASLVGGLLGAKGDEDATDAAIANNAANIAFQTKFAKKGIQWKTRDAKAAGIHPLYAMGASTIAFQPQTLGSQGGGKRSLGAGLAAAGQGLGRALQAGQDKLERALTMENMKLQNLHLEAQTAQLTGASQIGPPLPSPMSRPMIPGQGNSPHDNSVSILPAEITASAPGSPHVETGAISDYGYAKTHTGMVRVPSSDIKDRIEDMFVPESQWALRNIVGPMLNPRSANRPGAGPNPNQFPPKKGYKWVQIPFTGEYRQVKKGSRSDPSTYTSRDDYIRKALKLFKNWK